MTDAVTPTPVYDEHGHELIPLNDLQLEKLLSALSPNRVSTRRAGQEDREDSDGGGQQRGGGRQITYLEAWDIKRALDVIFGFGGWSSTIIQAQVLKFEGDIPKARGTGTNFRVVAQVHTRLHIHQLGASYDGVAISSQKHPDPGEAADFAIKTADSDALKRAANALGTQFGLSLYNDGQKTDVVQTIVATGQRRIDIDEAKLERLERQAGRAERIKAGFEKLGETVPTVSDEVSEKHIRVDSPETDDVTDGAPPPTGEQLEAGRSALQAGFAHPDGTK